MTTETTNAEVDEIRRMLPALKIVYHAILKNFRIQTERDPVDVSLAEAFGRPLAWGSLAVKYLDEQEPPRRRG